MIVNNVIYRDGVRIAEPDEIVGTYAQCQALNGMAWIGLYKPTREEFHAVELEFGLPELAVEDSIQQHQRPKVERSLHVGEDERFAEDDLDETPLTYEEASRLKKNWKVSFKGSGMVMQPTSQDESSADDADAPERPAGWFVKVVKQVKAAIGTEGDDEKTEDDD